MRYFVLLLFSATAITTACTRKRQIKVIAKDTNGSPVANVTCGAHDDERNIPLGSVLTNNQGEALLEFNAKGKTSIIIWSNECSGNWKGDARDLPKEWEFKCQ
jgi:hypothetical protein